MKRQIVIALLGICTLAVAPAFASRAAGVPGGQWLMTGKDANNSNFNPAEDAITVSNAGHLHRVWSNGDVVSAIVNGSRLYATTFFHSDVVAVDAATGKVIRHYGPELHLTKYVAPADLLFVNGRLVVATDQTITALNPGTGRIAWRVSAGATALTAARGIIYTGCSCPYLAINAVTGRVLWRYIPRKGQRLGVARPILVNHLLLRHLGLGGPGAVPWTQVFNPENGHYLTSWHVSGPWTGDAGDAYSASNPMALGKSPGTAVESVAANGRPHWKVAMRTGVANLALAHDTLLVDAAPGPGTPLKPTGIDNTGIAALDAATGQIRWSVPIKGGVVGLSVANHLVFAVAQPPGPRFLVLDANAGRKLLIKQLPESVNGDFAPMVTGGTVYLSLGYSLIAWRL